MTLSGKDKQILRDLAKKMADVASLSVQEETKKMWTKLNKLQRVKPLVWINEIPWHEMNTNDELTVRCEDSFCRSLEYGLRLTLYQWEHMRGDMVVEPTLFSPLAIHNTGFGISAQADTAVSSHYHQQIKEEDDIEKIRIPEITYDAERTESTYQRMLGIFDGILDVKKGGMMHYWFAPWDQLITWWGVQEALMDLVLRPDLVHKVMARLTEAHMACLDQYEALNLLSFGSGNYRVGSGGLGYTDELPQSDSDPEHIRPCDQWGCATAQIFSEVSPQMHEEFALQYEKQWLRRFGLTYYGCCEPLHNKIDMLREALPNLRKVSISPKANLDKTIENAGQEFVVSLKPNPAVLATHEWRPEVARSELVTAVERLSNSGCIVEVILKDITTVRNEPQRLWEWAKIAKEVTAEFS